MTTLAHDVDLRQELLGRIRAHQASINKYTRKKQGHRELVTNINIGSSLIAAALMAGPSVGDYKFTETVQKGLGWGADSHVWVLLCITALIVNIVAAISAQLSKTNDPTERIIIAEACNAALEELGTDVEFGKQSVKIAAAEYGKIAAKILFVAAYSADDTDVHASNKETAPQASRIVDRYRRGAEVLMPGMAIAFACIILTLIGIGLVQGRGVAAAGPSKSTGPQVGAASHLVLSTAKVKKGDHYSATAVGFTPGENVQFLWVGPTQGTMAATPPADPNGRTTSGPITENDPPGKYTLIAMGQTSRRIAVAELQVVQPGN